MHNRRYKTKPDPPDVANDRWQSVPLKPLLTALLAVAAGAAAADTQAQEPGSLDNWTIERFEWTSDADVTQLIVDNPYGDVRVRTAKTDSVELLALLQHAADDDDVPSVAITGQAGTVQAQALMPDGNRARDKRRVDISVLVPASTALSVVTVDGLIQARNIRSDIDAASRRGRIDVSTTGNVHIENIHGDVATMLIGRRWADAPTVRTQTGKIELWIDAASDARVEAATTGVLGTDFSIDIEYDERSGIKRGVAILGEARQTVRLESAKGDIRILRSPLRATDTATSQRGQAQ